MHKIIKICLYSAILAFTNNAFGSRMSSNLNPFACFGCFAKKAVSIPKSEMQLEFKQLSDPKSIEAIDAEEDKMQQALKLQQEFKLQRGVLFQIHEFKRSIAMEQRTKECLYENYNSKDEKIMPLMDEIFKLILQYRVKKKEVFLYAKGVIEEAIKITDKDEQSKYIKQQISSAKKVQEFIEFADNACLTIIRHSGTIRSIKSQFQSLENNKIQLESELEQQVIKLLSQTNASFEEALRMEEEIQKVMEEEAIKDIQIHKQRPVQYFFDENEQLKQLRKTIFTYFYQNKIKKNEVYSCAELIIMQSLNIANMTEEERLKYIKQQMSGANAEKVQEFIEFTKSMHKLVTGKYKKLIMETKNKIQLELEQKAIKLLPRAKDALYAEEDIQRFINECDEQNQIEMQGKKRMSERFLLYKTKKKNILNQLQYLMVTLDMENIIHDSDQLMYIEQQLSRKNLEYIQNFIEDTEKDCKEIKCIEFAVQIKKLYFQIDDSLGVAFNLESRFRLIIANYKKNGGNKELSEKISELFKQYEAKGEEVCLLLKGIAKEAIDKEDMSYEERLEHVKQKIKDDNTRKIKEFVKHTGEMLRFIATKKIPIEIECKACFEMPKFNSEKAEFCAQAALEKKVDFVLIYNPEWFLKLKDM